MNRRVLLITLCLGVHLAKAIAFDPFTASDINTNKLLGSWNTKLGRREMKITFFDSGRFTGTITKEGNLEDEFEGEWLIKSQYIGNPTIIWKFTKSRTIALGTLDRDEIETLNDEFLVLWTQKRERRAYRRIVTKKE